MSVVSDETGSKFSLNALSASIKKEKTLPRRMTAAAPPQDSDWKAALDIKPATSTEYSEMKAPSAAASISMTSDQGNVPSSSSYMVSSKPRLPNAIPGTA